MFSTATIGRWSRGIKLDAAANGMNFNTEVMFSTATIGRWSRGIKLDAAANVSLSTLMIFASFTEINLGPNPVFCLLHIRNFVLGNHIKV
ncbi:unnamed protein product [Leptidea sinapis]|uniref:Uncharacterized protein n=1 Tax=Leptidea sinapis TaxID=189913 RepID=A0A5E4Q981_9NEOP|nr:unnamed protein product [Leptidea sinapis]